MLHRLCSSSSSSSSLPRSSTSFASSPLPPPAVKDAPGYGLPRRREAPASEAPHDLASRLQWCAKSEVSVRLGRICHDDVCRKSMEQDLYLQSLLVRMYAKNVTSLEDAISLFSASCHDHHQSFIWNHIISGLSHCDRLEEALQFFTKMRQQGIVSDKFTFISLLSLLSNAENLDRGKHLHASILESGLHQNIIIATGLIAMYQRCGSIENAWRTFVMIALPDGVSWTAMISAFIQHNRNQQALHLHELMLREGFIPSKISLACAVDACVNLELLSEGMVMHSFMIELDIKADMLLDNSFLKLYSLCGSLEDAEHVFDNMRQKDVVSYNTLISGCAHISNVMKALCVFTELMIEGILPNKLTYVCILDACANSEVEAEGKLLHYCILSVGFSEDDMISSKLLKMYGKCGRLEDAEKLFDAMQGKNVIFWTTMISVFSQQGKNMEALHFFHQMQQEGTQPNKVTLVCLIDACTGLSSAVQREYVHVYILNYGLNADVVVNNYLINMYGKCSEVEVSRKVFDNMPHRDLISWSSMMSIYARVSEGKEAIKLFTEMREEVDPGKVTFVCIMDVCTDSKLLTEGKVVHFCAVLDGFDTDNEVSNALVNMYGKCGCLGDACNIFDAAQELDIIAWTTLIGAHAQGGKNDEAWQLFSRMQYQGTSPNKVTFVSLCEIYESEAMIESGKRMHVYIIECGLASDVTVSNAIIKMYGRCHSVDNAWTVFQEMRERDIVSWTAIIAVYAQHNDGKKALQLYNFMQLQGFQPNKITFVCILDACACCASLGAGEDVHKLIIQTAFETDVIIGSALINMYGKCGDLNSAWDVFSKMENKNVLSWTTIVALYAQHGRGQESMSLFRRMDHEGCVPDGVTLLNVLVACCHSGLVHDGLSLFIDATKTHILSLSMEHFVCMVDMLGRAGQLNEAELLIHYMPFNPTAVTLVSFLGSCRYQRDLERGERTAMQVLDLDSEDSSAYVILSNMYAEGGCEDD